MAKFADLKTELEEACISLRSFTLAKPGFTQRDGVTAIERVSGLCDKLKETASEKETGEATTAVVVARNCIVAAQTRLKLLRNKSRAS